MGYSLSRARANGETGVDILATKGNEVIHIEVIAFKSSGPARARDFFQAFFRAISRTDQGATRCVIALAAQWKRGLSIRAGHYGTAWIRLGTAFPELEIWCVNCDSRHCEITKWNDWAFTPSESMSESSTRRPKQ